VVVLVRPRVLRRLKPTVPRIPVSRSTVRCGRVTWCRVRGLSPRSRPMSSFMISLEAAQILETRGTGVAADALCADAVFGVAREAVLGTEGGDCLFEFLAEIVETIRVGAVDAGADGRDHSAVACQ
jgi:hypothetical protein